MLCSYESDESWKGRKSYLDTLRATVSQKLSDHSTRFMMSVIINSTLNEYSQSIHLTENETYWFRGQFEGCSPILGHVLSTANKLQHFRRSGAVCKSSNSGKSSIWRETQLVPRRFTSSSKSRIRTKKEPWLQSQTRRKPCWKGLWQPQHHWLDLQTAMWVHVRENLQSHNNLLLNNKELIVNSSKNMRRHERSCDEAIEQF